MRAWILAALATACGDDLDEPKQLTIAASRTTFHATSDVGIDCGGGADLCNVVLPDTTDLTIAITNLHPESCFFWKATVTPPEAGTCTVSGTNGACMLRIDRAVTVNIGTCVNP